MSYASKSAVEEIRFETSLIGTMSKEEICSRIQDVGVVPALRANSAEDALFVADALAQAGVPILELAMNAPEAVQILSEVALRAPKMIVGGGSITTVATAQQCLDAGARFLTSDGLVLPVVEFAAQRDVVVFPGAFTPTEVIAARNAGSDFVKVVPCDAGGGHAYIRSLKNAMPDVPLIAAGGVTQQSALSIVSAGATALGVGRELIPADAIRLRQANRIQELARRFMNFVDGGRIQAAGQSY
ncbi:MAG TPA: bifunctional 4-hydroxy-2-oxoglutarate aldolase/2-dehydro-3-deoxy-phosphogluconate aldolase [Candidatus Acidoferrum sp.]|jgi:2-dehydro-3-deoxyphosphogluconate aldolase/(4S)-4-hydroxy-2-oxoglutarate aldolase|nr:bifunctional 4-hydroxy-2-oxoglutarate aldolase/2-dehydro-3-deoxy-phosphogluconate aldolase [Candidatus Acidoferrum sp.]